MANPEEWRPFVNEILYGVQFHEQLTEDTAARIARDIIREPLVNLTYEEQYAALATAVESGVDLTRLEPDRHAESDFREFLSMILGQMDALRPWPDPPYELVGMSRWEEFADPVVIARVLMGPMKAENKINAIFDSWDDIGKRGAVLRLKSGAVVALVARWWPDSSHIAVVSQGHCPRPDEVIQELIDATALEADDFELINA